MLKPELDEANALHQKYRNAEKYLQDIDEIIAQYDKKPDKDMHISKAITHGFLSVPNPDTRKKILDILRGEAEKEAEQASLDFNNYKPKSCE